MCSTQAIFVYGHILIMYGWIVTKTKIKSRLLYMQNNIGHVNKATEIRPLSHGAGQKRWPMRNGIYDKNTQSDGSDEDEL